VYSISGLQKVVWLCHCAVNVHRAVQWHYIDELSNDTGPYHTFIYDQSPSSIYLQSNQNYGMISGASAQKCASAR